MKEININIEGYNVNGICVGCLNYNRKMYYEDEVKECYKILADIDVPDGLTIQVCWECLAAVRNTMRFQRQILNAFDVLMAYSWKHTFLNSPKDLTEYATTRLTVSETMVQDFDFAAPLKEEQNDDENDLDINVEDGETDEKMEIEVKKEIDIDANDIDIDSQDMNVGNVNEHISTDEDVSLSKLKKKKEKKVKKKTKKGKLPDGFKEIQLTEEEMFKLRQQDLEDKTFSKMKHKCNDCIISFRTKKLMEEHRSRKHTPSKSKSSQCAICKAYFVGSEHLTRHVARHNRGFVCVKCDKVHSSKSKSSQCAICKAYFVGSEHLTRHVARHKRGFVCVKCDKVHSVRTLAVAHSESHVETALRCESCGDNFGTKSKLSYHKITCCQERPQCVCCGKVFANKLTLKYHLKVLPAKTEKPKQNVVIPCKGCSKVFYSKKSYRAHAVIHEGLQYHCQVCNKPFQWKRNLARHMRNHRDKANGSLHECKQCGKRFSSRDCYNNHMRFSKRHVAEEALSHECTYCGKKFATKWCMIDHVDWEHLERIKYKCSICDKAFKTAKIMVAHMNNIHGGGNKKEPDGAHLCDICGKSYKTDKRLKGHVWAMHTRRSTEKSFKCTQCPATFTWQTSIYKHMKMMHDKRGGKQPRPQPPKKEETFENLEANRLPYYQNHLPLPIQSVHMVPGSVPVTMGI